MSWELKAGMRVVCIDGKFTDFVHRLAPVLGVKLPVKGTVYTLRYVGIDLADGIPGCLLVEIVNPQVPYTNGAVHEPFWGLSRFRPLDETRLDVFRNLLVDLPKEEELAV